MMGLHHWYWSVGFDLIQRTLSWWASGNCMSSTGLVLLELETQAVGTACEEASAQGCECPLGAARALSNRQKESEGVSVSKHRKQILPNPPPPKKNHLQFERGSSAPERRVIPLTPWFQASEALREELNSAMQWHLTNRNFEIINSSCFK